MPVTIYKSTDAGAPVLDGALGSLCALLDAVLVNGYGAKAAAGWSIEFTGANKRVYRPPTGLMRPYLRVQDDAPRPAPYNTANEARLLGYESMTSVDVGTGKFPATAATNMILQKTDLGGASPWIVAADERTMYIFVRSGDFGPGYAAFAFGEYFSVKPADNFNSMIIGNITETLAATPVPSGANENLGRLSALTAVTAGHFFPRPWDERGGRTTNYGFGKHGNAAHSAALLTGLMQYPNPVDEGLYLSQVWLHEPAANPYIRGRMRGFWHFLHPALVLNDGDTWAGTGALAGRTFMAIYPTGSLDGVFVIETSNTWETN